MKNVKIIHSIIRIFVFGINALEMDKYFGALKKIIDWKTSCEVDKGSIIDDSTLVEKTFSIMDFKDKGKMTKGWR